MPALTALTFPLILPSFPCPTGQFPVCHHCLLLSTRWHQRMWEACKLWVKLPRGLKILWGILENQLRLSDWRGEFSFCLMLASGYTVWDGLAHKSRCNFYFSSPFSSNSWTSRAFFRTKNRHGTLWISSLNPFKALFLGDNGLTWSSTYLSLPVSLKATHGHLADVTMRQGVSERNVTGVLWILESSRF